MLEQAGEYLNRSPNDEVRKKPNDEVRNGRGLARLWCGCRTLDFGPRISFGFRHSVSDFVIGHSDFGFVLAISPCAVSINP